MTDSNQQQNENNKTPGNKEVVKDKTVSHGFKNSQKRPAENQQNQAGNKRLKLRLAKECFKPSHDSSPFAKVIS
jgi:hypothetical protein